MKAIVYAALAREGWRALFSVAWEADELYWAQAGARVCRLREPLPLGVAEAARDRLETALAGGAGTAANVEPDAAVVRALRRAVRQAWEAAGDPAAGGDGQWRTTEVEDAVDVIAFGGGERGAGASAETSWRFDGVGGRGDSGERVEERGRAHSASGQRTESGAVNGTWGPGFAAAREALARQARQASACLQGRSLLREEAAALMAAAAPSLREERAALRALQWAALHGAVRLAAAIAPAAAPTRGRGAGLRCRRCGSGEGRLRRTRCASCGREGCAACEACAALGRSRECGLLALGAASGERLPLSAAPGVDFDRWGLSPAQRAASAAAVRFLRGEEEAREAGRPLLARLGRRLSWLAPSTLTGYGRCFLLWAVTGAGKTEMVFPLLETVLRAGGRALVATPRRDVVLELAPRLAKAFPEYGRAVLYGGSGEKRGDAPLTLATTHQLLRFEEAFDLVLIDEIDAFPYHGDPMLYYAASKARRASGTTVLLSATPPPDLQRAARMGLLPCARVPVRYHRYPLPVPRTLRMAALGNWLSRGKPPIPLMRALAASVERGAQLFVFVPYIRQVAPLVELLRRHAGPLGLEPAAIDGTASTDTGRADKVSAFRATALRLLVTTTILERGVTIPRSDVFILEAQHSMFDQAALVQMAGRAGRSADDPKGRVYFGAAYWSRSQRGAIRQIAAMNRLARRRGYLKES